jgi:menaquinone-dependent protoporphyrinogen oxidase
MSILIAYATKHGATRGIAERIAEKLKEMGLSAEARSVKEIDDLASYDAFVVGSASYFFHWRREARRFVRRNRSILASLPVWLFSSGPLGKETKDAQGRDLREVTTPKELAELSAMTHSRGHRVFFGALHRANLGFFFKLLVARNPDDSKLLPEGDFRDWSDIDAWAEGIGRELTPKSPDAVMPAKPAVATAVEGQPV